MRPLSCLRLARMTSARSRRRLHTAVSMLLALALTLNPLLVTVALSDEAVPASAVSSEQAAPSSSGSSGGGTADTTAGTSDSGSTSPSSSTSTGSGGSSGTTGSPSTSSTTSTTASQPAPAPASDQTTGTQPATTGDGSQPAPQPTAGTTSTGTAPAAGSTTEQGTAPTGATVGTTATTPEPAPPAGSPTTVSQSAVVAASPEASPQPQASSPSPAPTTATAQPAVTQTAQNNSSSEGGVQAPTQTTTSGSSATTSVQNDTGGTPSPTVGTTAAPLAATAAPGAGASGTTPTPLGVASTAPLPSVTVAPLSGNEPIVSSQSGDAAAQTGQSQSTEVNLQVSSGTTAGGTGSVSVENQASTTLDRTGSASAESGIAIALTPGPTSTGTSGGSGGQTDGSTAASSGAASATGLQSQNVVTNAAQASVQVNGDSSGQISVQSTNRVTIVEGAQADAQSGSTLAAPGGTPAPTISQVAAPSVTAAAGATSGAATVTGLTAQNLVTLTSEAAVTPIPSATGTITVQQSNQAVIENVGVGVAVSDPASSAVTPTPTKVAPLATAGSTPIPTATSLTTGSAATTTPQANGDSLASSGRAQATGLQAQNSVTTNADVRVTVQGENKGLITVLIETITQIFNFGLAGAQSGDAIAANGGSVGAIPTVPLAPVPMAASGNAQATGAKVDNEVNVSSSASVKVEGDNHNPINLFLDLFAWIGNLGVGWAQSGDAQATGGSGTGSQSSNGAIAQSGSAQALGLDAANRVNMSAAAAVNIKGSNYANINVRVRFHTYIWNEGVAYAASGNARSVGAPDPSATSSNNLTSNEGSRGSISPKNSGGSGYESSVARSGDAKAEGHNSSVQIASAQYANGNGSGSGFDAQLPTIVNQLPQPRSLSTADDPTPGTLPSLADTVGDVHAQSGDASSYGFQTGDAVLNAQIAHASNPGSSKASATNSFDLNSTIRGDSSAETGFAGVNATPIPTPTPQEQRAQSTGNSHGSDGHSAGRYVESQLVIYQASWAGGSPFHSTVKVNVPSRWPGFEQPPMPGQRIQPPEVEAAAPFGARSSSARETTPSGGLSGINPLGEWPRLELPPMPGQSLGEDGAAGPEFGSPSGGLRGPIEALIWSLLGMLALGAVVTRRGRAWITMWAQTGLQQARATARLIMGLIFNF